MVKRYKFFYGVVLLTLVAGLVFAGCGGGRVDTSTPEGVVTAFWDAFTKGDFNKAGQYFASSIRPEWDESLAELDEMPFIKDFVLVFMGSMQLKTTGHVIDGDTATVNVVVTTPDLDTLLETDEELMGMFFMMGMMSMAGPEGISKEDEALFKNMLGDIKKKIDKAPKITEEGSVYLVKENGQWKLGEMFDLDVF